MTRQLDQLAFKFFKLFAQYEYALKAMGYGRARSNGGAEPDWNKFANIVGRKVLDVREPDVAAAIQFLFDEPPKRQIWLTDHVEWEAVVSPDRSPQTLFGHISRVRNNLYHGGKFNGRWFEPERSKELITKSLCVLEALLAIDSDLASAIKENRPDRTSQTAANSPRVPRHGPQP
jgi:hypothetical protein